MHLKQQFNHSLVTRVGGVKTDNISFVQKFRLKADNLEGYWGRGFQIYSHLKYINIFVCFFTIFGVFRAAVRRLFQAANEMNLFSCQPPTCILPTMCRPLFRLQTYQMSFIFHFFG